MAPPVEDQSFRSERIPRQEEQPGLSGAGIFKLVGRTVVNAVAEEDKVCQAPEPSPLAAQCPIHHSLRSSCGAGCVHPLPAAGQRV